MKRTPMDHPHHRRGSAIGRRLRRTKNPWIEPLRKLVRILTASLMTLSAIPLLLGLVSWCFVDPPEPEWHHKTVPILEALTCFFGFVFVVSAALYWGFQRLESGGSVRLATRRGALRVALVVLLPGGALFWGFLHFAT